MSIDLAATASRVPAGRIERALHFGTLAGGIAANAAITGARRWWSGSSGQLSDLVLTPTNAERLVRRLGRMRGAAMKLGQLLSLEASAALPGTFTDALAALRASGDTMTSAQLQRVLADEYGDDWRRRFRRFDERPIAAASIGQVHRAITRDGRDLALKIQFPGVARAIGSDVDNLATLLGVSGIIPDGFDVAPLVEAVKEQLARETDYLAEASNLTRFQTLLASDPALRVPTAHPDLTTSRILAMDFVAGEPLAMLWETERPQAVRDHVGTLLQRLLGRELLELGCMQSDPNFANYMLDRDGRLVLLDFGSTIEIPADTTSRYGALARAVLAGDRNAVRTVIEDFGWLLGTERPDQADGLIDLIILASEPLLASGPYDYGASDLGDRVRDHSFDLAFRRDLRRPPPPAQLFLNRKLAGSYLLLARLGARVDSGAVVRELLA